jgi:hypothetical protein
MIAAQWRGGRLTAPGGLRQLGGRLERGSTADAMEPDLPLLP